MTTKQVIVMRKDLSMRKGKMIAQGAHASMAFLSTKVRGSLELTEEEIEWLDNSYTKICVGVGSEEELLKVYEEAKLSNLTVHLITDNGATEFGGVPTKTCLAIGPHLGEKIDHITKGLPLL